MPWCSQCGAAVPDQALFCSHCGGGLVRKDAEGTTTAAPIIAAVTEQSAGAQFASPGHESGEPLPIPENIAGVIAYITIFPAIVFLLLKPFKENFFVRFHAFQHLFLWLAGFAFGIAASILWTILQLIPFMRVLVFPFAGLIGLAWFFLWLLLVVKAYNHEVFKLPYIGDLAEARSRL
jgi:uncharacterized membrane protein